MSKPTSGSAGSMIERGGQRSDYLRGVGVALLQTVSLGGLVFATVLLAYSVHLRSIQYGPDPRAQAIYEKARANTELNPATIAEPAELPITLDALQVS